MSSPSLHWTAGSNPFLKFAYALLPVNFSIMLVCLEESSPLFSVIDEVSIVD